jgi:transposase
MMRYELSGHQADVAEQGARRVSWDDRRVLNGICWVLRSGAPSRDLPDCYGPCTTCYNRSSDGEGPEYGGGSCTHLLPLMTRPSK